MRSRAPNVVAVVNVVKVVVASAVSLCSGGPAVHKPHCWIYLKGRFLRLLPFGREIQLRGMSQDLSWGAAAQQYEAVLLAAKYQW